MTNDVDPLRLRFPALFREGYVDYADCRVRYTTEAAPEELVSRLHLVAVTTEDKSVVCRSEQGWRFLPGGTREPGETLYDLARRALMEEAGADLHGEPATSPRTWRTATEPSRFGATCLQLICIDTSRESEDPGYHRLFQVPDHAQWLEDALAVGDCARRIPFSHHPVFCSRPSHGNDQEMLETLLPLFESGEVRLVLAGHEHNFQSRRWTAARPSSPGPPTRSAKRP